MRTTIDVSTYRARISTEGFGFNTVHRINMPELWQWHEAVAEMIGRHHAEAMGTVFPCPDPVASTHVAAHGSELKQIPFGPHFTCSQCGAKVHDNIVTDHHNQVWCPTCQAKEQAQWEDSGGELDEDLEAEYALDHREEPAATGISREQREREEREERAHERRDLDAVIDEARYQ